MMSVIQPLNLPILVIFCSDYGAYNNFGAKPSIPNSNICIPNDATAKDVWFKFVAIANYVNLVVNGKSPNNPGGTLMSPQFLLYSGACNALVEIDCISDAFQNNNVEIFAGPLTPGQTYYINVSARNDNVGTFQLYHLKLLTSLPKKKTYQSARVASAIPGSMKSTIASRMKK